MGVGRRMKKQPPPAPLGELKVSGKRKLAITSENKNEIGKRRRSKHPVASKLKVNHKLHSTQDLTHGKIHATNGVRLELDSESLDEFQGFDDSDSSPNSNLHDQDSFNGFDDDDDELDAALLDALHSDSASDVGSSAAALTNSDILARKSLWSDDESDSALGEEQLTSANIEGLSYKLDERAAEEAAEAQAELEETVLRTNDDDNNSLSNPADHIPQSTPILAPDLHALRARMTSTVRILSDSTALTDSAISRAELIAHLQEDICAYYNYSPYLAEKLFHLFPPSEALAFFEANETPRPIVLRTNTLRTHRRALAQTLINRGVTLEPVGKWSKVGLQIYESAVPLGATPEYLAGHYILQAASSFLPVMALDPLEDERILDMAAAPGGKTTHISALMRNTGCVFANDASRVRAKGLIGNIHRLGITNAVVCCYPATSFPKVLGGFDRVLLDAPCSGTGVISKDPSIKMNRTESDFQRLPHTQKMMLLAAIDSVDHRSASGGIVVYSTCSVAVEENEMVVQYALRRRPNVKLISTGLPLGKEGFVNFRGRAFDKDMALTRRFYPHTYNIDGFYVAKLKKVGMTAVGAVGAVGNSVSGKKRTKK